MRSLIIISAVLLIGCTTVDKSAVQIYHDSFTPVMQAVKTVSKNTQDIKNDKDVYKYSTPESKFVSAFSAMQEVDNKELDDVFNDLNYKVKQYNDTLLYLASDDPIDERYVNSLGGDTHRGVFSTPFLYCAELYVQNHNFVDFSAAIQSNQPNIKAYTDLVKSRVSIMNSDTIRNYVDICNYINGPDIYGRDKVGTISYFVRISGKVNKNKQLIKDIQEFYATYPLAHDELRQAKKYLWYQTKQYYYIYKLRDISLRIKEQL